MAVLRIFVIQMLIAQGPDKVWNTEGEDFFDFFRDRETRFVFLSEKWIVCFCVFEDCSKFDLMKLIGNDTVGTCSEFWKKCLFIDF